MTTLTTLSPTPSLRSARSHASASHSTEAYEGLITARCMIRNGHLGPAEEVLSKVLLDLPNSATAWYKLALTQKLRGNIAAAAASAQRALAHQLGYANALSLAADSIADSDPPAEKVRLVGKNSQRIL